MSNSLRCLENFLHCIEVKKSCQNRPKYAKCQNILTLTGLPKSEYFGRFWREFLTSMQCKKFLDILDICYEYLRHAPRPGEYSARRIMIIRCLSRKISHEMWQTRGFLAILSRFFKNFPPPLLARVIYSPSKRLGNAIFEVNWGSWYVSYCLESFKSLKACNKLWGRLVDSRNKALLVPKPHNCDPWRFEGSLSEFQHILCITPWKRHIWSQLGVWLCKLLPWKF